VVFIVAFLAAIFYASSRVRFVEDVLPQISGAPPPPPPAMHSSFRLALILPPHTREPNTHIHTYTV